MQNEKKIKVINNIFYTFHFKHFKYRFIIVDKMDLKKFQIWKVLTNFALLNQEE